MIRTLEQSAVDPTILEFFGLTQPPFARLDDPSRLFHSEQYSLLMEHLRNTIANTDSLVVMCGADGSGKSTLVNRFISGLGDDIAYVVIDETCFGEEQFFTAFLQQIGFKEISGTANELKNITKEFLVCRGIAGDHVLIIIDNAHLADPVILEQLRWLCEIKIKDQRVLSVVLAGNADILRIVDAPAMSQTKFCSHVVFNIRSYSQEETASYVWHRLRLAGGNAGVKLSNDAISLIHRYSGGIPQLINTLCDDMLAEACNLESRVISDNIVRKIADRQQLLPHVVPLYGKGRRETDPDFQNVRPVTKKARAKLDDQQDHLARLSAQIEDLRADKSRALRENDAYNGEITELRKEIDSRIAEVEKLTLSLANNAEEVTQTNLALSNSATALQDSENKAKQLAVKLKKEVSAREAAQKQFAEAAATIEELSEQKKSLQATVDGTQDDLQAALKLADERTAEIEALEKASAALKAEAEGKAGELDALRAELDSRNEALAELETQLEETKAECESAELRITVLQDPKKLDELEKASAKLAADLESETTTREAAQEELSAATEKIEELGQLQQELQATVDGVQEELEAAVKLADERTAAIEALEKGSADLEAQVEGKSGELDMLQAELDSKIEALADLETQLEESRADCESAELRIAALKNPEELEEIQNVSDQLAADLRSETRQRKAAQKEVEKTTASVEELSQLKQELQATVESLQADLEAGIELAAERDAQIEALEEESAALKAEVESKTGESEDLRAELKLRNDILADLEVRFERSQAECELAQLRMLELKSPKELEEIESVSARLAAELEKEIDVRDVAQKGLADAKLTIEELSRQKQELQATVAGLEADLEAAQERAAATEAFDNEAADLKTQVESKTGELDALRAELDSRNEALADLETQLQESNAACEAAELQKASLKDPKELEEVQHVSDQLTANLKAETLARRAAQEELESAAATVAELGVLKQDLLAKVGDLEADLRLASERAVDAYILERNVADLEDQLQTRTSELNSRNEAFADIEKQLIASQKECELLRRRAPAAKVDEKTAAEEATAAPTPLVGVYSSPVAQKFVKSIKGIRAYQTLQKYNSTFYDGLINSYEKLVEQGLTEKQINDALRAEQAELMERLLVKASDTAVITYAQLIIVQLDEYQLDDVEPCLKLLVPQGSPERNKTPVYSERTKADELDVLDVTVRTYKADRPLPAEEDVWPELEPIFAELFDAFGADNVAALENSYDPRIDRKLVCNISRALYSGILHLPRRNAASALRWLLST